MSKETPLAAPNYTQAPNLFFDELLQKITSLCELKVTLTIIRQTFGWQKSEDKISVSQLEEATGLSRKGVQDGLTLALKRGYVTRRAVGQSFFYSLKVCNDIAQSDQPTMQPSSTALCNDVAQQLCNNLAPQKKEEKESKESIPQCARELFDFYGQTVKPTDKVHPSTRRSWLALIEVRLREEWTVEQIELAFKGCKLDRWKMTKGFNGVPDILTKRDETERLIELGRHGLPENGKKASNYESTSERNVRYIREGLGLEEADNSLAPRQLTSGSESRRT